MYKRQAVLTCVTRSSPSSVISFTFALKLIISIGIDVSSFSISLNMIRSSSMTTMSLSLIHIFAWRVGCEFGATAGKTDLAKCAKKNNLDAIHDTVHEMARDEARHGRALKGLLDRYFG